MEKNIFEGICMEISSAKYTKLEDLPEKRIEALEQKIAEQEKKINELDEALNIKFRSPYESHP